VSADLSAVSVGFIGAGQMATALARGFISIGKLSVEHVVAADAVAAAAERFRSLTGAKVVATNREVVALADVIILAVKPHHVTTVLAELAPSITPQHVVVSIAAGVTLATLQHGLGAPRRVVRVMPNTPSLVGAGAAAYALGGSATDADGALVERLLGTVGVCVAVSESQLDAVTGLSGSGPAFVYQFIEALSDGGVRAGLPRDLATKLAAQTVLGSAQMVLTTGQHPGPLKDAVTSPGGTTIAGLHALEQGALRGTVMNAVTAAWERAKQLSQPTAK
jgi:pyrroline-5-carboxylate reductase